MRKYIYIILTAILSITLIVGIAFIAFRDKPIAPEQLLVEKINKNTTEVTLASKINGNKWESGIIICPYTPAEYIPIEYKEKFYRLKLDRIGHNENTWIFYKTSNNTVTNSISTSEAVDFCWESISGSAIKPGQKFKVIRPAKIAPQVALKP